jgi:tRNA modification GTPase
MNDPSHLSSETSAAVLTGQGRGAVGVIRVWGPSALAVTSSLFRQRRGVLLAEGDLGRPRFGRFGDGDEVVALVLEGRPASVEIHGHGGTAAIASILGELEALSVVVYAKNIESTSFADQAEQDLARAETLRTAAILLDQQAGALEREIADLKRVGNGPAAASLAKDLLARAKVGMRLVSGWMVVLTGRPNVGKSRLLNAVAGFERAIVSPTAGTTRDLVATRAAVDGWPVELVDTAGLRADVAGLESLGIDLAREALAGADLVLVVLDRSEPLTAEDRRILDAYPDALRVANKSDLAAAWDEREVAAECVSAATGNGVDGLLSAISTRLVPSPPPRGSGVPFRPEHVAMIQQIANAAGRSIT